MSRANNEPEYRRRIREKAEKDQQTANAERHESNKKYNVEKIIAEIQRVEQEIHQINDEQTPQKKRDRYWERFGFLGLWFAGIVGIAAICVATHDASEQRDVMQGQLREMQTESAIRRSELAPIMHLSIDRPSAPGYWRVTSQWVNIGKTNALHFTGWEDFKIFRTKEDWKNFTPAYMQKAYCPASGEISIL